SRTLPCRVAPDDAKPRSPPHRHANGDLPRALRRGARPERRVHGASPRAARAHPLARRHARRHRHPTHIIRTAVEITPPAPGAAPQARTAPPRPPPPERPFGRAVRVRSEQRDEQRAPAEERGAPPPRLRRR